jgi:hypothetical protein
METVTGVVGKTYDKAIYVNSTRYSAFNPSQLNGVSEGATVEFKAQTSPCGQYNNIKGNVSVVAAGSSATVTNIAPAPSVDLPPHYSLMKGYVTKLTEYPLPADHPDNSIINQNSLTNAVNYYNGADIAPETVLETARIFAEFSSGRMDATAKDEALAALRSAGT